MAPNRGRNRARDFDGLFDSAPLDFDPEADDVQNEDDESLADSNDNIAINGAREHYADVGTSKLRKPKTAPLGPQYRGSKVSRDAVVEDEAEDDPFGRGFDEEDSDEDLERSGHMHDEDEESDEDEDARDSDMSSNELRPQISASQNDHAALRKLAAQGQKSVVSSLGQSTKVDVEKGRAVKRQKGAFDALLSSRIKLQKALVGTNTLVGTPTRDLSDQLGKANAALERAETAAFAFWSSLSSLRDQMISARTGEKRKRSSLDNSASVYDLWKHLRSQDEATIPHRNTTLQRWSEKVRGAPAEPGGIINKAAQQATIVDALQEHLSNRDRLLKRAHTPRSCAPLQLANGISEDEKIYDDADFYGLLLKELLEQRNQDSIAAATIDLNFNLKREAKAKKSVDTKASKGRKLRYTVHEKLQNFMAPEDRGLWSERQADELFKSLFGRRMGLGEDVHEDGMDDELDGGADEGLVLFRN